MPPSSRPPISTEYAGECLVMQLRLYVTPYMMHANRRPLHHIWHGSCKCWISRPLAACTGQQATELRHLLLVCESASDGPEDHGRREASDEEPPDVANFIAIVFVKCIYVGSLQPVARCA
eukprot:347947-Chlamydomonas_euryale.AAC.17